MCRMFAYVGYSLDELKQLFEALKSSAKRDVIAEKVGVTPVHGDGWGYVIYDKKHLYFYKTEVPIYEDEFPNVTVNGKFYAIFHARQATDKKTVNSRFSHPFMEAGERYYYFFAHNGYVDDEKLREKLGFKGLTTDTELAAKYYAITEDNEYLKQVTKSALNILVLKISRESGDAELLYENYYIKPRPEYYDLYIWNGNNGTAVISSTLRYYGISEVREVEKGKLLMLDFTKIF